jgi:protein O-mannosyl-transferase
MKPRQESIYIQFAVVGVLVLCIAALYGQFLWNPILFDDLPFFMVNEAGEQPISSYKFELFEIRSLPYATIAWTKSLFGVNLISFRVGNLLLHAAVVLVLYWFLSALFEAVNPEAIGQSAQKSLSPRVAAFFAALLFALHPISTYAVGYLVQRTIVMATLFSLLAMLSYVRGSLRQSPILLWLCVPFYYLAAFSKEHAIMMPFAIVALTVLLHEDWRTKLKSRWAVFAALFAIAIFVVLAKRYLVGGVYEPAAQEMLLDVDKNLVYPLSVITQTWLFFKYAFLWLFPNSAWMSIDMREPFARNLFSPYLVSAACFGLWGVTGGWLLLKRGKKGLVGFAMLFPWVMFFTEFSSVRIQESFVLYRSYLWAVGAFCLLPVIFSKLNARSAGFLLSIVALALFPISMERLMVLSQPMFVWDDAEKLVKNRSDLPGTYRIYYNRGTERSNIGDQDSAISDFKRAIELNGDFSESYGNLGAAYAKKDDWKSAATAYKQAIQNAARGNKTYLIAEGNLALAYANMSEWRSAAEAYDRTVDLATRDRNPMRPNYIFNRAQAYEHLGDLQKSQADYKLACDLAKKGCDKLK